MKKLVYLMFFISIFLIGCDQKVDNISDGESVKENKGDVPISFSESMIGTGNLLPESLVTNSPYIAIKTSTMEEHKKYWTDLGIEGEVKDVDFDKYDTYFITTFGSSSCPVKFKHFVAAGEVIELTIADPDPDVMCTMDYSPKNSVILVNKEDSKNIKSVSFVGKESSTLVDLSAK